MENIQKILIVGVDSTGTVRVLETDESHEVAVSHAWALAQEKRFFESGRTEAEAWRDHLQAEIGEAMESVDHQHPSETSQSGEVTLITRRAKEEDLPPEEAAVPNPRFRIRIR